MNNNCPLVYNASENKTERNGTSLQKCHIYPVYLINNQMQLLVAVFCRHKYFRESEFGLWIFQICWSRQKPETTGGEWLGSYSQNMIKWTPKKLRYYQKKNPKNDEMKILGLYWVMLESWIQPDKTHAVFLKSLD